MNRKHIIFGLIIILAISSFVMAYGLILDISPQTNDVIPHITSNNDNNSINSTDVNNPVNSNNNPNSKNNATVNGGGAGGEVSNGEKTKDESVYKTSDGKPRETSQPSGYSKTRLDLNAKANWIEQNHKESNYRPIKDDRGNVKYYINK